MPHVITSNPVVELANTAAHGAAKLIKASVEAFLDFFDQIATAQSRQSQIDQLNLLTDRELAERFQINRDQIVPYVFRDKMF